MEKQYGLTPVEWEIMDYLWAADSECSFKNIMEYVNNTLHKNWKKQTLSTYLKNLQLLGLINADCSSKNFMYYSCFTKEEHIQKWTRQLISKHYENSIAKFISAFTGGQKLSKKDAEELKKLLL